MCHSYVLGLFYPIVFYYYPLEMCLFPNEAQEWGISVWEGRAEEQGEVEGEETVIRIYEIRKTYFR